MEYRELGRTGLIVSRLCFGVLTVGPLQANLPLSEGSSIIRRGLELGINFMDTAQLYRTYPYIRQALRGFSGEVHIASKSYAYTYEGMRQSVEEARQALGMDRLSIFMLHEQESEHTLRGHRPALDYLLDAKAKGLISAVGISTHAVAAVRAAARMPEIDVIHPLINRAGIGILDGTADAMLAAVKAARAAGKGIYTMKPLGGGHLMREAAAAFEFLLGQPEIDAIAVGMKSAAEVELNARYFSRPPEQQTGLRQAEELDLGALQTQVAAQSRTLHVEEWCKGCGQCVGACPQGAIQIAGGKAFSDPARCVLCGYCGAACPQFALKIV
ncbi:MAG: aldo/keto reductase [Syntrophothermus sp.]